MRWEVLEQCPGPVPSAVVHTMYNCPMISRSCFVVMAAFAAPVFGASCDSLASFALKQGKVTLAAEVAPGGFVPGGGPGNAAVFKTLPAFCRVMASLMPTADSDIKIEVWLPVLNANNGGWNKSLQSVGNGAWAGTSVIRPWLGHWRRAMRRRRPIRCPRRTALADRPERRAYA